MEERREGIRVAAIVLAGGEGTRMKSSLNKLLHKVLGKEIIRFPVEAAKAAGAQRIVVVAGPHNIQQLKGLLGDEVEFALQPEPLGTADATKAAAEKLRDFDGYVFVVVGDSPYINGEILNQLLNFHLKEANAVSLISSVFDNPPPYGRIIKDSRGWVARVVEEIDATEEELAIKEVNSSYYCFSWQKVLPLLYKIKINPRKGEYYLTDIVELAYKEGLKTGALRIDNPLLTKGVNTRADLSEAADYYSQKNMEKLEAEGVTFFGKDKIVVEFDVKVGRDTVIYPFTYLGGGTRIGEGCEIGPFVFLKGIEIPGGSKLRFTSMEGDTK